MGYVSTYSLLTALKTELISAEWSAGGLLFDVVEHYSEPDLLAAYEQLFIFKRRVCLILPGADQFQSDTQGRVLTFGLDREFSLLIADRDHAKPQKAHLGDDETSGVCAIKDRLVDLLTGKHLGLYPDVVRLLPTRSNPFTISDGDAAAGGRRCWQLDWLAVMGHRNLISDRLLATTE